MILSQLMKFKQEWQPALTAKSIPVLYLYAQAAAMHGACIATEKTIQWKAHRSITSKSCAFIAEKNIQS
jgi:hypothetical protein